jgi:hypothetical protein
LFTRKGLNEPTFPDRLLSDKDELRKREVNGPYLILNLRFNFGKHIQQLCTMQLIIGYLGTPLRIEYHLAK